MDFWELIRTTGEDWLGAAQVATVFLFFAVLTVQVIVLVFQIRATNAAKTAAQAAAQQILRQRPLIAFQDMGATRVNEQPMPLLPQFPIRNMGAEVALDVHGQVKFLIDGKGQPPQPTSKSDLVPGGESAFIVNVQATAPEVAKALQTNPKSVTYEWEIRYRSSGEQAHWYRSFQDGMAVGAKGVVAGQAIDSFFWSIGKRRTMGRECDGPFETEP